MGFLLLLLTALGLSMDSCAMSAQKSLIREYRGKRIAVACAFWFGVCQTMMIVCGWLFGTVANRIHEFTSIAWLPVALYMLAGVYMIIESFTSRIPPENDDITVGNMLWPAAATSFDALVVGILFTGHDWRQLVYGVLTVASVTAVVSILGVWIGRRKGTRYNGIVQVFGGLVLVLLGVELLLEHLDVIHLHL